MAMKPDSWLKIVDIGSAIYALYVKKDGAQRWARLSANSVDVLLAAATTGEAPSLVYKKQGWWESQDWSAPIDGLVLWQSGEVVLTKPAIPAPRIIPAKCSHEHTLLLPGCPTPAHHRERPEDHERNVAARAVIKKWVASNYHSWPICHVSRQPVELQFWPAGEKGFGVGEHYKAAFVCRGCHG